MFAARLLVPLVALLFTSAALTSQAIAGAPPSTPTAGSASTNAATAAAANAAPKVTSQRAAGVVKSLDMAHQQVVVTINGAERTFTFANLAHAPDVRVGAHVEVIYEGTTASAITLHE